MTEPIEPKYAPDTHGGGGGGGDSQPDPDRGKDFTNRIPDDKVIWGDEPPSYNKPPADWGVGGGGGSQNSSPPTWEPVDVDTSAMREVEKIMLFNVQAAVDEYEKVKEHFLGVKDHVFGQNQEVTDQYQNGPTPSSQSTVPGDFAHAANVFASHMNPAAEKALSAIGQSLEYEGEFIALVNHAGQMYADSDKKSQFPPAPPSAF